MRNEVVSSTAPEYRPSDGAGSRGSELHQTDPVRRPLDERERELLLHMIDFADPLDRETLVQQADAAVVTGYCGCGCGCPTVDLEVGQERARPIEGRRVILDAWWTPPDDRHGGGVLLFIIEGWLSLLEVWWADDAPPTELPPPSEVVPSVQQS